MPSRISRSSSAITTSSPRRDPTRPGRGPPRIGQSLQAPCHASSAGVELRARPALSSRCAGGVPDRRAPTMGATECSTRWVRGGGAGVRRPGGRVARRSGRRPQPRVGRRRRPWRSSRSPSGAPAGRRRGDLGPPELPDRRPRCSARAGSVSTPASAFTSPAARATGELGLTMTVVAAVAAVTAADVLPGDVRLHAVARSPRSRSCPSLVVMLSPCPWAVGVRAADATDPAPGHPGRRALGTSPDGAPTSARGARAAASAPTRAPTRPIQVADAPRPRTHRRARSRSS